MPPALRPGVSARKVVAIAQSNATSHESWGGLFRTGDRFVRSPPNASEYRRDGGVHRRALQLT